MEITEKPFELDLNKSVYALALMPENKPLKLTEVERKVFNAMLKMSMDAEKPSEREDGSLWFSATLTQIGERLNMSRDEMGTDFYKGVCRNLMEVVLEFSSPSNADAVMDAKTGKRTVWKGRHLVEKVDIDYSGSSMVIYWRFDSELEPFLLNPTRFAQLKLESIAKLSSAATIVLYENCARYKDTETGSTGWKDWKWWVSTLTGLPTTGPKRSKTYAEFRYFKNRVIAPAIAEINEKTELNVEMDLPKKIGKAVSEIRFLVREKSNSRSIEAKQTGTREKNPLEIALIARATTLSITAAQIEVLLKKFSVQSIEQAMNSLVEALTQREEAGSELDPIRSNHAYMKRVLERMHGVDKIQILPKDLPAKKATNESSQDNTKNAPSMASSQELEQQTSSKSLIKSELLALPESVQREYAERALNEFKENGLASGKIIERANAGLWLGPFLLKMVEIYGIEKYGPDWANAKDGAA